MKSELIIKVKMGLPSITTIGSFVFLAYMFNSLWSIGKLYFPPNCDDSIDTKMVRKTPVFRIRYIQDKAGKFEKYTITMILFI